MSEIFVTTTNIDLTEGRGSVRPLVIHSTVENAYDHGKHAGVMGTSSGVTTYRVDPERDLPDSALLHGTLRDLDQVIGYFRTGVSTQRWGIIPERVEKLSDEEKARLKTLAALLGDRVPKPEPVAVTKEQRAIAVVWSGFYGSIADHRTKTPVPQIIGFASLVQEFEDVIADMDEVSAVIAHARLVNPSLRQAHVTIVEFGEDFTLSERTADWSEPEGFDAVAKPDQQELLAEYTALSRKAGLL